MSTNTSSPTKDQVWDARHAAGISQAKAAAMVHATARAWQYWEAGEREMPVALWELFCRKTNQWPYPNF